MTITVGGTSITFNDATVQTTAFTGAGSSPGQSATTYTTAGSYTFTIPSGVTKIKVTVVGGGGCSTYTLCGGTAGGNTGGTSSVSSGTQTISTVSATGGAGGIGISNIFRLGGLGSGGALNGYGGATDRVVGGVSHFSGPNSNGSNSVLGAGATNAGFTGAAAGGIAIQWFTGLTPGATLSVTVGSSANPGGAGTAGGPGVVTFEY